MCKSLFYLICLFGGDGECKAYLSRFLILGGEYPVLVQIMETLHL